MIKYPILLIAFLSICALSSQDVPIQPNGYGFSVGDSHGTLHIQFFLDFQCPDSKDAYAIWQNVRKTISLQQNRIKLTYQFNPLPYHFYAAVIHQAFFYVLQNAGVGTAEEFISYVFSKQEDFTEEKFLDQTLTQFIQQFSQKITSLFKLNNDDFVKSLVLGTESFQSLRYHWRYVTIEKGVSGAPVFYANGVRIDGGEEYETSDWINFIKKYKS